MVRKKVWKDRTGVVGVLTVVLVIILVAALAFMAYMVVAQMPDVDGDDQKDEDLDDDDEPDPIIGYMYVDVKMKVSVAWDSAADFSIEKVTAELDDEAPSMSIIDSLFLGSNQNKDMKIVVQMDMPSLNQKNLIHKSQEFNWAWSSPTLISEVNEYKTLDFTSGALRYHGSYSLSVTLYKMNDGEWQQVGQKTQSVVI